MSTHVKRTVYALLDDGSHSKTDFGLGPGILYTDTLTFKENFSEQSEGQQAMMGTQLIRENEELFTKLFKVEMETEEE